MGNGFGAASSHGFDKMLVVGSAESTPETPDIFHWEIGIIHGIHWKWNCTKHWKDKSVLINCTERVNHIGYCLFD